MKVQRVICDEQYVRSIVLKTVTLRIVYTVISFFSSTIKHAARAIVRRMDARGRNPFRRIEFHVKHI